MLRGPIVRDQPFSLDSFNGQCTLHCNLQCSLQKSDLPANKVDTEVQSPPPRSKPSNAHCTTHSQHMVLHIVVSCPGLGSVQLS